MALYSRLGHSLGKLGSKTGSGIAARPLLSGFQLMLKRKGHDWDTPAPPGYEHIFLPKKDLPALLPKGELTPEKQAELAAKYNLRPEDYKPLANLGDYPELPLESASDRDPYYDWDDPNLRRNFGEPLHYDSDMLHRFSPLDRRPVLADFNQIVKVLLTIGGTIFGLIYIGEYFPQFRPIAPKQYPEWFSFDNRFDGGRGPLWPEYGRRPDYHYAFPPSPNDHSH